MHHYDGYERWIVVLFECKRCYLLFLLLLLFIYFLHILGQILERDGTDIVPPEFQRYVDAESVNFIENICIFEGIHRRVVSAAE